MPGFEVIGNEEREALNEIFDADRGILFAHGFEALRNNNFRVRDFEKAFAHRLGAAHAQAVSSGSTALYVALKSLGVGPGDEVITQSFTFVATVEAILMAGATPVITEIDETFNMSPDDLERKVTDCTKVIIPVHMAGVPAAMRPILAIAKKHNVKVLEDTAQGIGAKYDGRYLGTLGDAGCFSLDFGKTITSGEGGMVLTNDESLFRESLAFHDHGHEYNPHVGRADDTRHSWGFNFRMTEMQAAVGLAQLKKLDRIIDRSRANKTRIEQAIFAGVPDVRFRTVPEGGEENYDSIYLIFESPERTKRALANLKASGLGTKNVPDALKWHFAGAWEHMFSDVPAYRDNFATAWPESTRLLERSIALPVMVNWDDTFLSQHIKKLVPALAA